MEEQVPNKTPPAPASVPNGDQAVGENQGPSLATKIARLVEERGWNQEEFARIANLNRQTVRQILKEGDRNLRIATVSACARALDLSVNDLRTQPLDKLLARVRAAAGLPGGDKLSHPLDAATQPELKAWIERNAERARQLSAEEADELLSLQQESGGPLASFGVEHFVEIIERKRRLIQQVHAIAGTEYLDLLEKLVGLIYDKIQPYRDRT